jgi:hypothetical protein
MVDYRPVAIALYQFVGMYSNTQKKVLVKIIVSKVAEQLNIPRYRRILKTFQ